MNGKDFWIALKELTPALFQVYSAIHKLSENEVGYCFASNITLSEKIGKEKSNISKGISKLIKLNFLNTIEIKRGFVTEERRIYTNSNYKLYLEDKENIDNLVKTTYEEKEGIFYYYNERNLKNADGKNATGKITNGKSTICSNGESASGTDGKNAKVIVSNNNLSKSKEKSTTSAPEKTFEEHLTDELKKYKFTGINKNSIINISLNANGKMRDIIRAILYMKSKNKAMKIKTLVAILRDGDYKGNNQDQKSNLGRQDKVNIMMAELGEKKLKEMEAKIIQTNGFEIGARTELETILCRMYREKYVKGA